MGDETEAGGSGRKTVRKSTFPMEAIVKKPGQKAGGQGVL